MFRSTNIVLRKSMLALPALAAFVFAYAGAAHSQAADTIRANNLRINSFALTVGHYDDESFLVNAGKSVAGPRSTKDIREVKCGTADCYLIVMGTKTPTGDMVDSVWADRRTFALVRHVEHGFGNHTEVNVANARIKGVANDSGKPARNIDEPAPAFDFSVVEEIIANLPLKDHYSTVIHTYDVTQGFRDVGVTVTGAETLETSKGKNQTWVVDLSFGTHKATRWFDKETKLGLKWLVDMGGGRSMWGQPPT